MNSVHRSLGFTRRVALMAVVASAAVVGVGGGVPASAGPARLSTPVPAAPAAALVPPFEVATAIDNNDLWTLGNFPSRGNWDWHTGVAPGSSPAIASVPGGYELAVHTTASDDLWTIGFGGNRDWHLQVQPGTSPSIAALAGGGYEVAFQTSGGSLATVGSNGARVWSLGMMAATSPSITALRGGGTQIAFQSSAGTLWTVGDAGWKNWGIGMCRPSSPSIANQGQHGFEVAVDVTFVNCKDSLALQGLGQPSNDVWTVGTGGTRDWHTGLIVGTSPAITQLTAGGYELALPTNWTSAFLPNNADLWTIGDGGYRDWNTGIGRTTPSITSEPNNGFEVAVYPCGINQMWVLGTAVIKAYNIGHQPGNTASAPAITQ